MTTKIQKTVKTRHRDACAILMTVFLLGTSVDVEATTQADLDAAVACCWGMQYHGCLTNNYAVCRNGGDVCKSYFFSEAHGQYGEIPCSAMGTRGGTTDGITKLFVKPGPLKGPDGEIFEVSEGVAKHLLNATSIMELQRRGASDPELNAAISEDVSAALSNAGLPSDMNVKVRDDAESGDRVFTLRGEGADDIVLRFDSNGNRKQDAADFSVADNVRAAMAEAGNSTMNARGGWCATATPTGGCAVAQSPNVGTIPGASGTPQFASTVSGFPMSTNVFPAASMPLVNWTIPNRYNAISLVEFANLGFIRTQTQFEQLLGFCWIPNSAVAGSGSCQANPTGVCPYDQNAGITCQSMMGF